MDYREITNIEELSTSSQATVLLAETLHDFDLSIHKSYYKYMICKTLFEIETGTAKDKLHEILNAYYWDCMQRINFIKQTIEVTGGHRFLTSTNLEIFRHFN